MAKSTRLPPARAEHIGSFLRPAELHAEIERVYAPNHTALLAEERTKDLSRLHALEDKYIKEIGQRSSGTPDSQSSPTASSGATCSPDRFTTASMA